MDFEAKSRVYILVDEQKRITQIEGEYSLSNIPDLSAAILIEEGEPCDRLNHAQSHYLPKPLYTEDGLPRYKWTGAEIVERTEEELEADREARFADAEVTDEQAERELLAALTGDISAEETIMEIMEVMR